MRSDLRALVASALCPIAVAFIIAPFTPAIPGVGGPTSDGLRYAAVVSVIRDGSAVPTEVPYVHRILPAVAVAALPLGTREGFLLLNGLATIATGPLLFTLLRRHRAMTAAALLGVLWWAVLPTTVRYTLHNPTTLDAIGLAFLVLLLLLASDRKWALFGVALAPAVLTRENTLLVSAVLWLRMLPDGLVLASARTAIAVLPAAVLLTAVRVAPPVPPTMWWTQYDLVLMHMAELLTRADVALRAVAALPLSLGLFAVVPFVAARSSIAMLRRERGFGLYVVATLALGAIGGLDHDRFWLWLVPVLAVLTFAGPAAWNSPGPAAALTVLHLLAARFLWPMDDQGRALLATSMDPQRIALGIGVAAAAAAGTWAVMRRVGRRAGGGAGRTVPA